VGIPSRDPTRAPVALAVATIALRNTPQMLTFLESNRGGGPTGSSSRPTYDERPVLNLLAEGFDMLEEDLDKERFFALVRRTYWQAAEGSATRALMQTLIGELAF
jgi:hypothetical protein